MLLQKFLGGFITNEDQMTSLPLAPALGTVEGAAERHKFVASISESHLVLRAKAAVIWLSSNGPKLQSKPQEYHGQAIIVQRHLPTEPGLILPASARPGRQRQ